MLLKTFGKNPTGKRLERIMKSKNYTNNSFQNLLPTEVILGSASAGKLLRGFINRPKAATPQHRLPSVKTDLKKISTDNPAIIWFGHSSYLIVSKELTILVDPIFGGNVSPVSFFGKSFPGTEIYTVDDLPQIDIVIITHDHYDHLNYETIKKLANKVKFFYAPLGVGAHLEAWGIEAAKITEFDWWESKAYSISCEITATPTRHFSGRAFVRGKTLWTSYVLKISDFKIFIGGDSGYDGTFKEIGDRYGPFDLIMLECGQYGEYWPYIHMLPENTVKAAKDLKAKVLFPVHWGKFTLAYHEWNEPIKRLVKAAKEQDMIVTTPLIGEMVVVNSVYPQSEWWHL